MLAQHRAGAILTAHRLCRLDGGHRGEHFGFLCADRGGIEARGRLHGHHRKQREHVVRDHVAQRPGCLVELAALLHAHRLRHGDLHVIDPVAVPDRFEQPIGEAERHDALDRVFSEKVVDAENLVLVQRAQDAGIQLARRVQAMAERLLDHHAAPEPRLAILVLVLIGELRFAELLHHGAKESVGDGEVEDDVALRAVGLLCLGQRGADLLVQLGLGKVALNVGHFLRKPLPRRLVDVVDVELRSGVADEAFQHVVKVVAPALGGSLRQVHADQREFLRQHLGAREIVERRHHQALGQVTAGTEDHHGAGIGRTGLAPRRRLDHLRGRRYPEFVCRAWRYSAACCAAE